MRKHPFRISNKLNISHPECNNEKLYLIIVKCWQFVMRVVAVLDACFVLQFLIECAKEEEASLILKEGHF